MLQINNLTHCYGNFKALDNLSFQLSNGIYALLGPNGAGKSTMINLICGNLKPSEGEILFDGQNIEKMGAKYRSILGYSPQEQAMYNNFTANDFLYYIAALKGVSREVADKQINELFERLNLTQFRYKKVGGFSGGMKQRVLIAQALLGDPKLVILDEPTAGLDPKERIAIKNFISEVALEKIVIFATHVVSDIEYIAKEIIMLRKGKIVRMNPAAKLISEIENKVYKVLCEKEFLKNVPDYLKVCNVAPATEKNKLIVRLVNCSESEIPDFDFKITEPNLEDIYIYLFGV